VLRGALCGVTLRYLDSPEQVLGGDHSSINFVLTPETARGLTQAFVQSACLAEGPGQTAH